MSQPNAKRANTDECQEMRQLEQHNLQKFEAMEKRFEEMEKRHQGLIQSHEDIKSRFKVQENKIEKLEAENKAQKKEMEEMKAIHCAEVNKLRSELVCQEQQIQSMEKAHQEELVKLKEDMKAQLKEQQKEMEELESENGDGDEDGETGIVDEEEQKIVKWKLHKLEEEMINLKDKLIHQGQQILEIVNGAFSGNVALMEKEIVRYKIERLFVGRWKWLGSSGDRNEYHKQFGDGFFYWMAVRWFMAFEIHEAKLRWIRQERFLSAPTYREFVLDEEFEGVLDGNKCKVLINMDGEKLVGNETRSDGKMSVGELTIDANGNLLVTMESGGVKCTEKYEKMEGIIS